MRHCPRWVAIVADLFEGVVHIVDDEEVICDSLLWLARSRGIAATAYESGNAFLNSLDGKAKFDPQMEPVFLASPAGILLPRILGDIAALVSGGVRGILLR